MDLIYLGKTKDVYRRPNGKLEFHFKDDATGYIDSSTNEPVFDSGYDEVVGKIPGKGKVSCQFTKYFFELLRDRNIPTHYIDTIADDVMVADPADLLGAKIVEEDLEGAADIYNLEWVFRFNKFGSFWRRYPCVRPCQMFDEPLVEIYAKGKAGDPDILMVDETVAALGIMSLEELKYGKTLVRNIAREIYVECENRGVHLLDGKLELGKRKSDGGIVLIDDISPDVIRVCRGAYYDCANNCTKLHECIETKFEFNERKILAKNLLKPNEISEIFGLKYGLQNS